MSKIKADQGGFQVTTGVVDAERVAPLRWAPWPLRGPFGGASFMTPPASGGRNISVGWVGLVEDGGGAEVVVLVEVGVGVEEVEDGARGRGAVGHPAVEEPEVVQHRRAWGARGERTVGDVNPLPRIAFAQTSFSEPLETTARHSTPPENDRSAKGTRPF